MNNSSGSICNESKCSESRRISSSSVSLILSLVCELIVLFCTICIVFAMRSSCSEFAVLEVCNDDAERPWW